MENRIDILMATYNGERYIRQQILSIISQTYSLWNLYIHDDGSTDNTVLIIKEFCLKDDRIKLIDDKTRFGHPASNFMHLLKHSSANYICFCDQDDIWFENKLEILYNILNQKSQDKPCAIFSNAYLYEDGTNIINGQLDYKIHNLKQLLFVNGGIHGNRTILNKAMKNEMLKFNSHLNMHDHLLALIACSFGEIVYVDKPLFLYRQHRCNVSGLVEKSVLKRCIRGFSSLENKHLVSKEIYEVIKAFKEVYKDSISISDNQLIQVYLKMNSLSTTRRLVSILKNGFSLGSSGRLQLIIKASTRKYSDYPILL